MSIYGNIVESSTLNRAKFGFLIKPHQNIDETLKKHKYEGYLKFCKSLKNIDDLKYMRSDTNMGINTYRKIGERIELCKSGKNDKNKGYYDGIKKQYMDKGITKNDCDLTIEWFKTTVLPAISERIKELKK